MAVALSSPKAECVAIVFSGFGIRAAWARSVLGNSISFFLSWQDATRTMATNNNRVLCIMGSVWLFNLVFQLFVPDVIALCVHMQTVVQEKILLYLSIFHRSEERLVGKE